MINRRNIFLAILTVAFVIVALFQIFRLAEENNKHKELLNNSQGLALEKKQYLNNLDKSKQIIDDDRATPTEIIRRTMEFVHNNSVHLIDEEHRKYAFDMPLVLNKLMPLVINKLLLAYQGHDSEKPHLSCGPRSYAMREILIRFGIISRLVQVFSDDYQQLKGHRLLEVFNPETESWEVWDPDFRVTFIDPDSKRRLDIMEIVFGDKEKVVPQDGAIMGWEETKTTHLREHYFEAVLFEGINIGIPNSILIINRHEFNLGKMLSDGLTLKEWMFKHYLHPRFITLPYDQEALGKL
jgi:hypothetical protein